MSTEHVRDEPGEGVDPLPEEDEEAGVEPLDPEDLEAAPEELEEEWEDEEAQGA
jgi:hypothetical protein